MNPTQPPSAAPPGVDVTKVHAAVDRVVMANGFYAPWELLLDQGRLDYKTYEAWRTGATVLLTAQLHGNTERITAELAVAAQWATQRGVVADRSPPTGWGPMAGRALRCAREDATDQLMRTVFRPDESAAQRDLFVDAGETMALASLRSALNSRDASGALDALQELLNHAPNHRLRAAAERLCDALDDVHAVAVLEDPADELARLDGSLTIDADDLLASAARDFCVPFWRRLAQALADRPYDPATPNLHASYALARCLDWNAARDVILATARFETHPALLLRFIEAEQHLGDRTAWMNGFVELCWRYPESAEQQIESDQLSDLTVLSAFDSLLDVETDPPLDARWLPAWMLLTEPGLADALRATPGEEAAAAGAGYLALKQLVGTAHAGLDSAAIDGRKQLGTAHPALLRAYLARSSSENR